MNVSSRNLIREPCSVRKLAFTASVMVNWLMSRMGILCFRPR